MEKEKRIIRSWWIFFTGLIIVTIIVFNILNYIGMIGKTAVEREVFEQSYQKQAGDASRQRHYRAQLAHINSLLVSSPNDAQLKAQKAMLQIQIQGK